MRTAVLYIRVSTDEQAIKGYSLQVQEERLRQFCKTNTIHVIKVIKEDHSAKSFIRPAWTCFIKELKKVKSQIPNLILFTKWDRFSRNIADSYYMIELLKKLKIEPQATEQPLDLSVPENKILLAVYIATSEVENDRRSINIRQGIHKARQEGRWANRVPLGYTNQFQNGKKCIVPQEPEASLIKNAYLYIQANQHDNIQSIYNRLIDLGLKCSRSHFWRIIRNPFYSGKIVVPKFENVEAYLVKGNHEAIISETLFKQVQQIINSPNNKTAKKVRSNDKLSLRGLIGCPHCGNTLTGSKSKGKNQYYYYYHCHHCCAFRIRADHFDQLLVEELNKLCPDKTYQDIYIGILKLVNGQFFNEEDAVQRSQIQSTNKLIERIIKAKELLVKGEIELADFSLIRTDCEKRINDIGLLLQQSTQSKEKNRICFKETIFPVLQLGRNWQQLDYCKKRAFLSILLEDKPITPLKFRLADFIKEELKTVFGMERSKRLDKYDSYLDELPQELTLQLESKIVAYEKGRGNYLSTKEAKAIVTFMTRLAKMISGQFD